MRSTSTSPRSRSWITMSTVGLGFRYFSTIAPHFGQVNSVFIISPLSKMKGMFPICIEGNPPIHRPQTVLLPKSRPKAQQGIFKPCPVIQSFQRKTNSAHLSLRETRNHPPPHYKSLGRGRMGVLQKGSPSLPQFPFPTSTHPKARGTASPRRDREARKQDAPCGHGCRAGQATRRGCRLDSGTRPRPQEAS